MEPRSSSRGQSGRAASSAAAAGRAITERGGTSSGGNSDSRKDSQNIHGFVNLKNFRTKGNNKKRWN